MQCKKCGTEVTDPNVIYCPSCKTFLYEDMQEKINKGEKSNLEENTTQQKSSSKTHNIITTLVLLIIFCSGIVGLFYYQGYSFQNRPIFIGLIGIIILVGLIKLLQSTESIFLCSGIYIIAISILNIFLGVPFILTLIIAAIRFPLASLYFWLLKRFDGYGLLWWVMAIVGAFIGLV